MVGVMYSYDCTRQKRKSKSSIATKRSVPPRLAHFYGLLDPRSCAWRANIVAEL